MYSSPQFSFLELELELELDGGTLKVLTYSNITGKLKETLHKCGIESTHFSGHSFRRGEANFALHCGVPSDYIKLQGRVAGNLTHMNDI